MDGRI